MSKVSGLLLVASGIALATLGTKYGPAADSEVLVGQHQVAPSDPAPRASSAVIKQFLPSASGANWT